MEKVTILDVTATKTFLFAGEELNVKGEVSYDPDKKELKRIGGSIYAKADPETGINGDFLGSFDGHMVDGQLKYNVRDMTVELAAKFVGLVAEITEYAQHIIDDDDSSSDGSSEE